MELLGEHLIGFSTSRDGPTSHAGRSPVTGAEIPPGYADATAQEIDAALSLARAAAARHCGARTRADLLMRIAASIEELGDALLARAESETALPRARLSGERQRTCAQLRTFAAVLLEGSWADAVIEHADPGRAGTPKPDVRRVNVPLGPVAIFGASNFPLAFSVAGGDTASALAAGCPAVVKAHPAHPGTSEMVGRAIVGAARALGIPEGAFSLLFGADPSVGIALALHPAVRAIAFTGSHAAGSTLAEAARTRPDPIPVHAEMGSVNPVVLLPGALEERGEAIAEGLSTSMLLGVGQFCTNPGLVLAIEGSATDRLLETLARRASAAPAGTMLHRGIREGYARGIAALRANAGVRVVAEVSVDPGSGGCVAGACVLETDDATFLAHPELAAEVFGPSTLVVRCASRESLASVVRALPGQLTATIHASAHEVAVPDLLNVLSEKVGRLIWNGFPTGVEVGHAMHHGGPYPATSDPRFTSVGSASIRRFLRPLCYQGFPQELLPRELHDGPATGS